MKKLIVISTVILLACSCGRIGPRTGAICNDGWKSSATGRGACSHHGGVDYWLHEDDYK